MDSYSKALVSLTPLILSFSLLTGCDAWPLYVHLPDPNGVVPEPQLLTWVEDAGAEELEDLGELSSLAVVTIEGTVDSCGFDPAADTYVWPVSLTDTTGDGLGDTETAYSGWYTGDQDGYSWTAGADLHVRLELEWDNAPEGGVNSPWRPADEAASWTTESDLDLVLFSLDLGVLLIVADEGVSNLHPESSGGLLAQVPEQRFAVVVACHHGVPSPYRLTIETLPR